MSLGNVARRLDRQPRDRPDEDLLTEAVRTITGFTV
jgi:hypothetical protein